MDSTQRLVLCRANLARIYSMLRSTPQQWREFVNIGRSVIMHLDTIAFLQLPLRIEDQIWMVNGLQQLAFADADSGNIAEIASWCSRQWLTVLQRDPQNVAALRGIGQSWFLRAQPALSRIQRSESSSSSSGESAQVSARSSSRRDEEVKNAIANAEAERRIGTADYVEARGFMQPATEYLERAVSAAKIQNVESGELITMTAEAYMSLGNTSSPRRNEPHFRRAVQLLRMAAAIPGHSMSRYLQQYLEDYGRLVD